MWQTIKRYYDTSETDEEFFDSLPLAYEYAGKYIVQELLFGFFEYFTEKRNTTIGIIGQLYQDIESKNWKSVYDLWHLLMKEINYNLSSISIEEVVIRKNIKDSPINTDFIIDWLKGE